MATPAAALVRLITTLFIGLVLLFIVLVLLCSARPAAAATAATDKSANPSLARARKLLGAGEWRALLVTCDEAALVPGVDAEELRETFVLSAIAYLVLSDEPRARTAARMAIALGGDLAPLVPADAPPRALVFFDAVRAHGPPPALSVALRPGSAEDAAPAGSAGIAAPAGSAGIAAPAVALVDSEGLVAQVNLYLRAPGSDTYERRSAPVAALGGLTASLPAGAFEYFLVAETSARTEIAFEGGAGAPRRWAGGAARSADRAADVGPPEAKPSAGAPVGAAVTPSPASARGRLAPVAWYRHPTVWGAILGALGATILVVVAVEVMPE